MCESEYNQKGNTKGITQQRSTGGKAFCRMETKRCFQREKGKVAGSSPSGQYYHMFIFQLIC